MRVRVVVGLVSLLVAGLFEAAAPAGASGVPAASQLGAPLGAIESGPRASAAGKVPANPAFTPFSKFAEQKDGSVKAELYAVPRFREAKGEWSPIDPTVRRSSERGFPLAAPNFLVPVRFGSGGSTTVQMQLANGAVSLKPVGLDLDVPVLEDGWVVYREVAPSTDLRYRVTASGIKEELVLKGAKAPHSFRFLLDDPEQQLGSAKATGQGGFRFDHRPQPDVAMELAPPVAYELSSDGRRSPADPDSARLRLEKARGGFDLKVSVSPEWLRGKKFPIALDPTFDFPRAGDSSINGYTQNEGGGGLYSVQDQTDDLFAGTYGSIAARSVFRFDLSGIPWRSDVSSAEFRLYKDGCLGSGGSCPTIPYTLNLHPLTSAWTRSSTWNQLAAITSSTVLDSTSGYANDPDHWQYFDLNDRVQRWVNGEETNNGFVARVVDESPNRSGPHYWSSRAANGFATRLTVSYRPNSTHGVPPAAPGSTAKVSMGSTSSGYAIPAAPYRAQHRGVDNSSFVRSNTASAGRMLVAPPPYTSSSEASFGVGSPANTATAQNGDRLWLAAPGSVISSTAVSRWVRTSGSSWAQEGSEVNVATLQLGQLSSAPKGIWFDQRASRLYVAYLANVTEPDLQSYSHLFVVTSADGGVSFSDSVDLGRFAWSASSPIAFQFLGYGASGVGLLSREGGRLDWRAVLAPGSTPVLLSSMSTSLAPLDNFQAVATDDGANHLVTSREGVGQSYRVLSSSGTWGSSSLLSSAHRSISVATDGTDLWLAAGASGLPVTLQRRSGGSWVAAPSVSGAVGIPALPERIDPHSIPLAWSDSTTVWLDHVDDLPPTVEMVTPASGSTLSGTVNLSVAASDPGVGVAGVQRVDFYVDRGNGWLGYLGADSTPDGNGQFSYSWNTAESEQAWWSQLGGTGRLWPEGAYQLYAVAHDYKGRNSQSPRVDGLLKLVDVGNYEYRPSLPVPLGGGVSASVNLYNGNLSVAQTDVATPTVIGSMGLTRTYNSLDLADRKVGLGWALSADLDLSVVFRALIDHSADPQYPSGTIELVELDGMRSFYLADGTGSSYRSFGDAASTLARNGDGTWSLSLVDGSRYSFDAAGKPTGAAPPSTGSGPRFTHGYDPTTGLLTSIQDPANRALSVTYSSGRVASVRDVDPTRTWTYTYDASNRLAVVSDPANVLTSFGYTSGNRMNEIKDGRNQSTYFDYDASGRVNRIRRATGSTELVTTIAYTSATEVSVVAPRGNQPACDVACKAFYTTTYTLDSSGRLTRLQRKLPDGTTVAKTIGWDEDAGLLGAKRRRNLRTSESDWQGNVSRFTYDEAGQQITATDALGNATRSNYDEAGSTTAVPFDGSGIVGEYFPNRTFTPTGSFPLRRIDASLSFDWGACATPGTCSPDPSIGVDQFSARWSGWLNAPTTGLYTFRTLSDDGVRLSVDGRVLIDNWTDHAPLYDYSPAVLLTAGAHEISFQYYENAGGAVAELSWEGPGFAYRKVGEDRGDLRPGLGLLTSTRDPGGHVRSVTYDTPFRRLRTSDVESNTDASGAVTTLRTRYDYTDPATGQPDAYGRLRKKTLPRGAAGATDDPAHSTVYAYYGLQETAVDPCTGASVNQAGGLKSKTFGNQGLIVAESYTADVRGNVVSSVDGKGTARSCYDARNRLVSFTAPDRATATTFGYDNNDNRLSVNDPVLGESTYVYDDLDRLSSARDVFGALTTYAYNDFFSPTLARTTRTSPAGTTQVMVDQQGRTVQETFSPAGGFPVQSFAFSYDSNDRLDVSTLPGGVTSDRDHDSLGRVTALRHRRADGKTIADYGSCPAPLAACPITYDGSSRKLREDGPWGSWRYAYDRVGRLEQVHDPRGFVRRYRFDVNSNRTALETRAGHSWERRAEVLGDVVGTPLALSDAVSAQAEVSLPFPVSFYGQSLSKLWVSADGFASLAPTLAQRPPLESTAGFFPFNGSLRVGNGNVVTASDDPLNPSWFMIRWRVQNVDADPTNVSSFKEFAVQFFRDGRVRYLYEPGSAPGGAGGSAAASAGDGASAQQSQGSDPVAGAGTDRPAQVGFSAGSGWDWATVGGLHGAGDTAGQQAVEIVAHGASTVSSSYNPRDQLVSDGFDGAGNTLSGGGMTFGYDGRSLLTQAAGPSVSSSFAYDGEGRQVRAVANGSVRRLHYSAPGDSGAAYETTGAGVLTQSFVSGPAGLLASTSAAGAASYPLADPKGSVAGTLDGSGGFTLSAFADEYGKTASPSAGYGYLGAFQKQTDPTGIIVMGARGYQPTTGRFLQRDPIEGGCANDYVYVNDPVNELDLDGQKCPRFVNKVVRFIGYGDVARGALAIKRGDAMAGASQMVGGVAGGTALGGVSDNLLSLSGLLKTGTNVTARLGTAGFKLATVKVGLAATAVDGLCNLRPRRTATVELAPAQNFSTRRPMA